MQALDKLVVIEVDGVLRSDEKGHRSEGVPIDVPQHVYDLLPWGEQLTSVPRSRTTTCVTP